MSVVLAVLLVLPIPRPDLPPAEAYLSVEAEVARPDPAARAERTAAVPEREPKRTSPEGTGTAPDHGVWAALADCESDQRWDYNGPSGFDGGLQFHPRTWRAFAPADFPSYAYQASPAQQIAVAERVLEAQGWKAWPRCSRKLGLR